MDQKIKKNKPMDHNSPMTNEQFLRHFLSLRKRVEELEKKSEKQLLAIKELEEELDVSNEWCVLLNKEIKSLKAKNKTGHATKGPVKERKFKPKKSTEAKRKEVGNHAWLPWMTFWDEARPDERGIPMATFYAAMRDGRLEAENRLPYPGAKKGKWYTTREKFLAYLSKHHKYRAP